MEHRSYPFTGGVQSSRGGDFFGFIVNA